MGRREGGTDGRTGRGREGGGRDKERRERRREMENRQTTEGDLLVKTNTL